MTRRRRTGENNATVLQVRIDDIRPNRAQPRIDFDTNSIIRLADSIRRYGILQPLSVRRLSEEGYLYELIAGERRLRAARSLGYCTVPCVIVEADEKMSAELAIIENLLREDLNMFEQAYGFRQLIDNYSMTQEEIARKISLSQSAVANKLRLLRLSYDEQRRIIEAELTERHARALLRLSDFEMRRLAIEHIVLHGLNVAETERYVDKLLILSSVAPCGDLPEPETKNSDFELDKAAKDVVYSINKGIENIRRLGSDAEMNIEEDETHIEIHVKIAKIREKTRIFSLL